MITVDILPKRWRFRVSLFGTLILQRYALLKPASKTNVESTFGWRDAEKHEVFHFELDMVNQGAKP